MDLNLAIALYYLAESHCAICQYTQYAIIKGPESHCAILHYTELFFLIKALILYGQYMETVCHNDGPESHCAICQYK